MSVNFTIEQGGFKARVTKSGELVVAPLAYNETQFAELAAVDTAYNFYEPRSGKQFVMTNVFAFGDKQVSGTTNATVEIYEATTSGTTTVDKTLIKVEVGQNQFQPFSGVNILVRPGFFINAKTDDDDVHMTITGYYIDVL